MNFKESFCRGDCSMSVIQDWTKLWLSGIPDGQTLQEFLGLSEEEYQTWLAGGDQALEGSLSKLAVPRYIADYLTWDELGGRLEDLVKKLLRMDCEVTIKRVDYYYWEMQLDIPADIGPNMSAQIRSRLDLQTVEPDFFVDNDSVYNDQMLSLLGRLIGREVSSSHADDDGVWIICKEYWASSQAFAASLIAQCEQRLRKEIRSGRYPTVNRETALHRLLGFKDALKQLGLISEDQLNVDPSHISDCGANRNSAESGSVGI